jgi:hypothetical protein
MNTTEAVIQALQHHRPAALAPTGALCSCGTLGPLSDFDRHVARQILMAIEDTTPQDAA